MMKTIVRNSHHERLDTIVEGADTDLTIVFAHGHGTNKNEYSDLFVDISKRLSSVARIVRFDFSGYGKSEGKQEEMDLNKLVDDLSSVLSWVRSEFGGRIMIIAHSLGTLVTRVLSPEGIEKMIFTGITLPDAHAHAAATIARLRSRPGGVFNEHGISSYPRKDGKIQKIGSQYWTSLRSVDPLKLTETLARKTDLIIIKPRHDEIVGGPETTIAYKGIPGVTYLELNGDHNFTDSADRQGLLMRLTEIIESA